MLPRRLLFAFTAAMLAAATATAEVKWSRNDVLLDLDSSNESGLAKFEFVNNGDAPVRIEKVSPGCGCTVPTLEKQEYAAGESGAFTARFTVGERRGVYRIPIHVAFADGSTSELNLVVQIRELVKYEPVNLIWSAGEERKPKEIEMHWQAGDPVEVTSVRSVNPKFKVELAKGHEPNSALVRVTPVDGDTQTGTTVVIMQTAQGAGRRTRVYTVVGRAL